MSVPRRVTRPARRLCPPVSPNQQVVARTGSCGVACWRPVQVVKVLQAGEVDASGVTLYDLLANASMERDELLSALHTPLP